MIPATLFGGHHFLSVSNYSPDGHERTLTVGVNAALQKIADRYKRTAFRKALAKSSPDWWQPESYWSDVLAHIKSLDLFPKALFKKKLRLESDE